jgi:riboflavin kinase/FMN adenylyltransferase
VERWRGLDGSDASDGPSVADLTSAVARCVVTIGMFDGVHRGHRQIIGRAVELARQQGVKSVVLTFDPHPSEVVRPGSHPAVLTSARYKAEIIEQVGADVLWVLPFTVEFSQLDPDAFIRAVLVDRLAASAVVVGANFRYGHKAAGNLASLTAAGEVYGYRTEGVSLVGDGEASISSTQIRKWIADGEVGDAAQALGRPHRVEGVVVRGDARGRTLGFPTANLATQPYVAIPADGVYSGHVLLRGVLHVAAISIGTNPTFEGRERRLEAFILDFDEDIYGDQIAVTFHERLRGTVRFDSIDDLVTQMHADVAEIRTQLC